MSFVNNIVYQEDRPNYIKHKGKHELETKIKDHKEIYSDNKQISKYEFRRYNPRWTGEFIFIDSELLQDKYKANLFETVYVLEHYSTPILKINLSSLRPPIKKNEIETLSGIWNSLSDINGINKCLKAFNLSFHYSGRRGFTKT